MPKVKKPIKKARAGSQKRAVKKSEITEDSPLLKMELRFADEYLIDFNQSAAAIRAGYSPTTARNIATQLMRQLHVRAYIGRKTAEQSKRTGTEYERIIKETARLAFANITDLSDDEGQLNFLASRDDTAAISSIKVKRQTLGEGQDSIEREIKIADKTKALELLLKYGRLSAEFEEKARIEREKIAQKKRELDMEQTRIDMEREKMNRSIGPIPEGDGFEAALYGAVSSVWVVHIDEEMTDAHGPEPEPVGDVAQNEGET